MMSILDITRPGEPPEARSAPSACPTRLLAGPFGATRRGYQPSAASETLRLELAGSGVQVLLVFLGSVDTAMHAAALRAFGDGFRRLPLGRPDEAARRIVRALRRCRSTLVYPGRLRVVRSFPTVSRWFSDRVVIPRLLGEMARMPR